MELDRVKHGVRHVGINRTFNRIWAATVSSNLTDGLSSTAAPLLAAALTRDPLLVGGVTVVQRLPWFLFSVFAGGLIDRLDRRYLVAGANAIRALVLGLFGLAVLFDRASIALLYVTFFCIGTAETFVDNATTAILPTVVSEDRLEAANGRLFSTRRIADGLAGRSLGGVLYALFMALPFLLGAGFYAAAAGFLLLLSGRFRPTTDGESPESFRKELTDGLRWFWNHRLIRTLSLAAGVGNVAHAASGAILVLFAQSVLELDSAGYGLLLGVGTVGGIVGGFLAGKLSDHIPAGTLIFGTNCIMGLSYLGLGSTTDPVIAAGLLLVDGFALTALNTVVVSLRQTIIPDELFGRVNSVYKMIGFGSLSVGGIVGGLIASRFDLPTTVLTTGVLHVLVAFVILPVVNNRTIARATED